jgi:hypothetical protein
VPDKRLFPPEVAGRAYFAGSHFLNETDDQPLVERVLSGEVPAPIRPVGDFFRRN